MNVRNLDPDRRRPGPKPRYWPLDIDLALTVCDQCSAVIPATDRAHEIHNGSHQKSGAGSSARTSVTTDASPVPDPPVPTPSPEAGPADRGGVEGANQADAGAPLSDVTTPLGDVPPAPGGTNHLTRKRARPEPGETGTGRAQPTAEEAERADRDAWERAHAAEDYPS